MLKAIFRLIVISEAAVGVVLTALLLLGQTEPNTVANTLSVIGVLFLIVGIAPSTLSPRWRRLSAPMYAPGIEEGSVVRGRWMRTERGLSERIGYLVRAVIPAAITIGTGLLLYFFPIAG
jgi:hypothetical protein